ncbi:MAG TPA: response regulator [bacterium]|nr:response regulator [bacterium]
MKILIVDDDQNIRFLFKEDLKEEGYEVIVADSGKEALRLFEEENPDIVSLDISLPDISGIELLRTMKEKRPDLPIIMTTAYDYRDDFSVWASDSYIIKSSDTTELKETIKSLMQKKL